MWLVIKLHLFLSSSSLFLCIIHLSFFEDEKVVAAAATSRIRIFSMEDGKELLKLSTEFVCQDTYFCHVLEFLFV